MLPECIATLGCREEGFPKTYLGLPLSNTVLKLSAFTPIPSIPVQPNEVHRTDQLCPGLSTGLPDARTPNSTRRVGESGPAATSISLDRGRGCKRSKLPSRMGTGVRTQNQWVARHQGPILAEHMPPA